MPPPREFLRNWPSYFCAIHKLTFLGKLKRRTGSGMVRDPQPGQSFHLITLVGQKPLAPSQKKRNYRQMHLTTSVGTDSLTTYHTSPDNLPGKKIDQNLNNMNTKNGQKKQGGVGRTATTVPARTVPAFRLVPKSHRTARSALLNRTLGQVEPRGRESVLSFGGLSRQYANQKARKYRAMKFQKSTRHKHFAGEVSSSLVNCRKIALIALQHVTRKVGFGFVWVCDSCEKNKILTS